MSVAAEPVAVAHASALPPRSWRLPIILAVLAVVTFVVFGLFGTDEEVRFAWSRAADAVSLDPSPASPRVIGLIFGALALLASGFALWSAWNRRKVGVWVMLIVGIAFLVSLVAWVGAGGSVPVVFLLTGAIGLSTAIVFGALAGVIGERAGIVNIAIEGQLLGGAFTSAIVASTTGSYILALLAAMVTGALISMVLAVFSIRYLVDQVIVGVVLIGLVTAITNFFYSAALAPNSGALNNPGTLDRIRIPLLADIPVLGPVLFDQRLTTYLMFVLVPLTWFVLFKTKWGLRVRALGEHPLAADTVGIKVNRWRFWAVTIAGLVAGLGGASLTIGSVGAFVREMSAGQGFIALAAVILGRWNPFYAALAALLFGFASNFRIWAGQAGSALPPDLIAMTPYVVTILAVALVAGRVVGPKAAGKPYLKE
ncbi:ABC transporter permease [Homoserinibacter sp. GY 40078]|uniref:ABC transporter permease subunit n=1 Tax=Homoserinibacter sp. GY 40078 TaxID=2603275 RepID=UPI0011CB24F6|nr:ABC transporter permease [Homoserinibacter sp. GY 40078]TXK18404.1 ABC transporter permease [Homoserinibacter sp. GY 40078]